MRAAEKLSFIILCALPFVAIALAAARPLHELSGHDVIGGLLFAVALACAWRLVGPMTTRDRSAPPTLGLSGVFLVAPWALIALLWVGLGAPFQASALENVASPRARQAVVPPFLLCGGPLRIVCWLVRR